MPERRDPCQFDAIDGTLILASVGAAVAGDFITTSRDYPDRIWPSSGGLEATVQVAGWILFGLFLAGPLILGIQRWVKARAESWDIAELMWFWIPTAWLLLLLLSLLSPENPILIIAIALMWLFPPMIVAGSFSLWKSVRQIPCNGWRWTSLCGSSVAIIVGLYGIASILSGPTIY
jgi:hypothetical protein